MVPQCRGDHGYRNGRDTKSGIFGSVYGFAKSISPRSLRFRPTIIDGESKLDWISIAVVYWVILVSEASRGLVLPSTWPYVQALGGTQSQLGIVVAALSIGRICTTIPLGYLSDKVSTRHVLLAATIIQVIGHAIYAMAPNVFVLITSRIIAGFGSATMSVCRAHIARAVPPGMRTYHFAYVSALQFIGYAVLPGVGGLLTWLPEVRIGGDKMVLNGFTYPGWVLVICNFLAFGVIYMAYVDPPATLRRNGNGNGSTATMSRVSSSVPPGGSPMEFQDEPELRPDAFAMFVCLLVNLAFRGAVAELETISTPFLMDFYRISFSTASYYLSLLGMVGLCIYMSFKPIARLYSDRNLVIFGLVALIVGCLPLSLFFIARHLPFALYVFLLGISWSIAYPVGQTATLSLFSKVLAGLPAGGFLGIFSACGSLARVIFAMLAGKVWYEFGREAVFVSITAYSALTLALTIVAYKRLVPPVC